MASPSLDHAARMCIYLEPDETKCYANREALTYLAEQLNRIAEAEPDKCFEVHIRLALSSFNNSISGPINPNVWVIDKRAEGEIVDGENEMPSDAVLFGHEVTFMHVTEEVLDSLKSAV